MWPMLLIKSSHNFSKSRPKSSSFYFESMFSLIPKVTIHLAAFFLRKFATKKFQKSPNLVTLASNYKVKRHDRNRRQTFRNVDRSNFIATSPRWSEKPFEKFELQKLQQCDQSKCHQTSVKVAQKWLHTFTKKIPNSVGNFAKLVVARGFKKVAQSALNHPIWSHCLQVGNSCNIE